MVARDSGARPARVRGRGRRLAAVGLIGVATALVLSGCSWDDAFGFGWPKGITVQSHMMRGMWVGSTIAAFAVGIIVWGLIFWCIIRYRKRPGDTELPVQTRYNLPIELLYTVVPFLVIAVLFYYTAVTQTAVDKITKPDVTVDIIAFKWNWQFTYEGTDNVDPSGAQITTIGDSDYIPVLVVPTGENILFVENSKDVIHSFWVPELLFKRDVFPGNVTNRFEVTINSGAEGAYVGRCAELCGTYHSQMNFELRAVSPTQYDQFLALKRQGD